ncbi:unnamed protein product [Macrosiphum euphorbiae]|uniref:G-protein coupled receptors family 1 profile domain-containing protein n=1 Tax=Macrosiphum euphorbiae TaxID=13131 RepID=A0AAV0XJW3_9HEMI|nr:unnamed protein product [Macrosiphum euphorbiae]
MELAVTNATASPPLPASTAFPGRVPSTGLQIGVTSLYAFGIFGNLLALFILHRTRSSSNQKHGFMLRCLATNDCIALTGMLVQMFVSVCWPGTRNNVWSCRIRVLWRFFGLGSGCVAIVMAVERWLALTKPFFYQKVRTHNIITLDTPVAAAAARVYTVHPVIGENNPCISSPPHQTHIRFTRASL